jgi:hypothetical protein
VANKGEHRCGGESVSQPRLKDKAFSTFLRQNPPFELRPEMAFRRRLKKGNSRPKSRATGRQLKELRSLDLQAGEAGRHG